MPEALKKLIANIAMLPGIGEKTATKIAFFLLGTNKNYIEDFRTNLANIKENIGSCSICHAITDIRKEKCSICENLKRDHAKICIVEEYLDLLTIEQAGGYDGVYHILGGAISPINGIFVWDLHLEDLFRKIIDYEGKLELILATNPNIEWEATTSYIREEIEKRKLRHKTLLTRLSRGLSSGYIEYADNMTIINAMRERKTL